MRKSLLVLTTLLVARDALAQCRSDVDCKGSRICVAGACEDPPPGRGGSDPKGHDPARTSTGWALGAAVYGIVGGVIGVGLGAASAATNRASYRGESFDATVPIALGAASLIMSAITVPIVAGGAASARDEKLRGALGLRITGWVAYGLTLANGIAAIVLGTITYVPTPVIVSLVSLGAISTSCMIADAFISHNDAAAMQPPRVTLLPNLSLTRTTANSAVPTLGLAGVF